MTIGLADVRRPLRRNPDGSLRQYQDPEDLNWHTDEAWYLVQGAQHRIEAVAKQLGWDVRGIQDTRWYSKGEALIFVEYRRYDGRVNYANWGLAKGPIEKVTGKDRAGQIIELLEGLS
jgi:hypothetical protein